MKHLRIALISLVFIVIMGMYVVLSDTTYFVFNNHSEAAIPLPSQYRVGGGENYTLEELRQWKLPEGPLRVGIQVGHLQSDVVPEELSDLAYNGAGAIFGIYNERDTVEVIAELVAAELRSMGVLVDVLPATVPPGYVADAFVSIHADGNDNNAIRGFKIAGPQRDYSGRAEALVDALYESYTTATGLPTNSSISRRMTAYYAFNWPRYEHAVHPFTPAVIVETGFLTNAEDRSLLQNEPQLAAAGIANGITNYLQNIPEPLPLPQSLEVPALPLIGTMSCASIRSGRSLREGEDLCVPSLTQGGRSYLIVTGEAVATTSFPYSAQVTGRYRPIQTLNNYFWFPYEVAGVISSPTIAEIE